MKEIILNIEEIKKLNFNYLENIYDNNIKFIGEELVLKNENGVELVRAKRKYTYFAKNQIKTRYMHCWILGKGSFKQTKTGWLSK